MNQKDLTAGSARITAVAWKVFSYMKKTNKKNSKRNFRE